MSRITFEDIDEEFGRELGTTTVQREEIREFARQYDPLPLHMDDAVARESEYGDIIASGFMTLIRANRIVVEELRTRTPAVAGLGLEDVRLPSPVFPDDELKVPH